MLNTPPTERAKIRDLNPAGYNPRVITPEELERLGRSMREFGIVQPLVARRADGLLIGGHQRLAEIRALYAAAGASEHAIGDVEVPVVFVEVDDDRAKVLNLALNKIGGDWDYAKLAALATDLGAVAGLDLELTGFGAAELLDIQQLYAPAPFAESSAFDPAEAASVDEKVAALNRRFTFDVPTDEQAVLVRAVLQRFGMTGPRDAGAALAAALATVPPEPAPAPVAPAKPKGKAAKRKPRK